MKIRRRLVVPLLALGLGGSHAAVPDPTEPLTDYDVRLAGRATSALRAPGAAQLQAAESLALTLAAPRLRWNLLSGSPQWLSTADGAVLAQPVDGPPDRAAAHHLAALAPLIGVSRGMIDAWELSGIVPAADGGSHVYFVQRIDGLEVFQGRAQVGLSPSGALRTLATTIFDGDPAARAPLLDADSAIGIALSHTYADATEQSLGRPPSSRLIWFPTATELRLAWEVRVAEPTFYTDYLVLVDADGGELLYRKNRTLYARARVLTEPLDPHSEAVSPAEHRMIDLPATTTESPAGWIGGDGTVLDGNNASSHLNYRNLPGLDDPSASYDEPFATLESALVNSWYWANVAHDRWYAAGFTEAAGNFQDDNFGLGGLGGDALQVVGWNSGARNNAFYSVAVDGDLPAINMLFMSCEGCTDRDGYPENLGERHGGYDINVVLHEIGHGLTTRMVGGPGVDDCLFGVQSGGMGEGWSDVVGASLLDDPKGGDYLLEGFGWVRDLRHDLDYDDLCTEGGGCAVHGDGMIWAATLWELRASLVALDPTAGVADFERIMIEALKSTPCNPTMLDARDALLQADTTLFAGAHHGPIWNAFAARRMGETASSTDHNDTAPVTDDTVPAAFVCSVPTAPTAVGAAAEGDNAVRVDYTVDGDTSAVEIWREDLDNPFDRAAAVASTPDATSYLDTSVQGGKSYRYHVVALGDGGVTCRSAASSTADATAAGDCEHFPIFDPQTTIAAGTGCSLDLGWNAAAAGCPGEAAPIVYNVYRQTFPGFEPGERNLIGRTASTGFSDTPPDDGQTYYYIVLAQHGDGSEPADHRFRGASQVLDWEPYLPAGSRTLKSSWDFESGDQGWIPLNDSDPVGGWVRVEPSGTAYGGALLAPDAAPSPGSFAWVTGDSGSPANAGAEDNDSGVTLQSPAFDGTGGARTILSFDYWNATPWFLGFAGIQVQVTSLANNATLFPLRHRTVQTFDAPAGLGWQRAEIDLAEHVSPSANMRVLFITQTAPPFSEFGIDNVRIETAGACGRSSLTVDSLAVDDSPPDWGNGNGILEAGETAYLKPTVRNDGGVDAPLPTATLRTSSRGVVVHQGSATLPSIPAAGSAIVDGDGFTVSLPPEGECGDTVALDFEFVDQAGVVSIDGWVEETGTAFRETVFTDDFETDKGWESLDASPGEGIWQRGDPVGTSDGGTPANPEDDSPGDAGAWCFVTENGPVGGAVDTHDVDDPSIPFLVSPFIDLTGYKRAEATFDVWFYDNATQGFEDFYFYGVQNDPDGTPGRFSSANEFDTTSGWVPRSLELTFRIAMTDNVRLSFGAWDRVDPDRNFFDNVVEMGIDNVVVEGELQTCAASGVLPPNGVGATLLVDKSATVDLGWTASPTDASHDAAVYYRVHRSRGPASGFEVLDSPIAPASTDVLAGPDAYYLISAVNGGGTSGDEPLP